MSDSKEISWLQQESVLKLCAFLDEANIEARFVGGCVRDSLCGLMPKDMDLATPETPDSVMEKLSNYPVKVIPMGIEHGTVIVVVDQTPFEITTLRRDVQTDGRHATVAFTDNWEEDAKRRDFTINAFYMDFDGTVFDPLDGLQDLYYGRVKFIGDPTARIQEDYLRILRYFRFMAHMDSDLWDRNALQACKALVPHIASLSRERITGEVKRLLSYPHVVHVLEKIEEEEISSTIFGESIDLRRFHNLELLTNIAPVDDGHLWLLRLVALLPFVRPEEMRLSGKECAYIKQLQSFRYEGDAALLYDYPDNAVAVKMYSLINRGDVAPLERLVAKKEQWKRPHFPLRAEHLISHRFPQQTIGTLLKIVERWWIERSFKPNLPACLEKAHQSQALAMSQRAGETSRSPQ